MGSRGTPGFDPGRDRPWAFFVRNVYLDTNVPSFLTTTRVDPASVVRRELTRRFWHAHASKCRLFVSELVIADAHYACASVHGMDLLLTWNIRHLANPGKTERLAVLKRRLGLATPVVCTPEALIEEDSDG